MRKTGKEWSTKFGNLNVKASRNSQEKNHWKLLVEAL